MFKKYIYKNFVWSIGTTSYRQGDLSYKLEVALQALESLNKNSLEKWVKRQKGYLDEIEKFNVINYSGKLSLKDARAITSSLQQLGLCTKKEREITEAGQVLLDISKNEKNLRNDFYIATNSYFYLLQLLKKREIINLFYLLILLKNNISLEEFKIFIMTLPANSSYKEVMDTFNAINNYREIKKEHKKEYIDNFLYAKIKNMDNYNEIYQDFVEDNIIPDENIQVIGINRKGVSFDIPISKLYILLKDINLNKSVNYEEVKTLIDLHSNSLKKWKKIVFGDQKGDKNQKKYFINVFVEFIKNLSEKQLREWFFRNLHLNRWKSNIDDYFDLNKRMLATTGVISFFNETINLSTIPYLIFEYNINGLRNIIENGLEEDIESYIEFNNLYNDSFKINKKIIASLVSEKFDDSIDINNVDQFISENENDKFETFIKKSFTRERIVEIFKKIEKQYSTNKISEIRKLEKEIKELCMTKDASIPTIFEYVTAIAWYYLSEEKIRPLQSLNLTLSADFLPITHAGGGQADLIIKYSNYSNLPAHDLLIEVSLTKESNQRRAEMEPVTRHLGEYKIKSKSKNAFCIFLTHKLDINTIIHFRTQKNTPYIYNGEWVEENKIIPIEISNIVNSLKFNKNYEDIYWIAENAYQSQEGIKNWWIKEVREKFEYQ